MASANDQIQQLIDDIRGSLVKIEDIANDFADQHDDNPPDQPSGPPTPPPPPVGGQYPSDVLPVLKDWTIMLPTGSPGDPDNEYLAGVSVPDTYFVRDGAVVFRTHPGTANHSKNSKYGRSEARQMVPTKRWAESSWPSGTASKPAAPQKLRARLAVDASRLAYPIVNSAQIHDGSDDVMQVQLRDGALGVAANNGAFWQVLDPHYVDGTPFVLDAQSTGRGEIAVTYNGAATVRLPKSGTGWYWKVGCYPNTGGANPQRPEKPEAYCEVVVYELTVDPA